MTAVLEPLARGRDVVRRALALRLHEHGQADVVLAVHGAKGSSSCSRSELGSTTTDTPRPSAGGAMKPLSPGSNPFSGRISPTGASRRTASPASLVSVSVVGSKASVPASAEHDDGVRRGHERQRVGVPVVALGEVAVVAVDDGVELAGIEVGPLPLTIAPGPQALASTSAPMASKSASSPSRSMVARTCSEPGVTSSCVLARRPLAAAWHSDGQRPG